ncbi:hypothetical protein CJ195_02055 [Bacillus sp. UMB0899]|nr:hypothetical protein CJ195_02055 [Bacillus sp. UMB0899]
MKQYKTLLMILFTTILLFLSGCAKDEVTPALEQKPAEEIASGENSAKQTLDTESKSTESEKTEVTNEETEKNDETTEKVKPSEQDAGNAEDSNSQSTEEKQTATTSKSSQAKESERTTTTTSKTESTEKKQVEAATKPEQKTEKTTIQNTENTSKNQSEPVKDKTTTTPPVKVEQKKEEPKKQEPKPTVTISVVGDSEKGTILSATKVEMSEGNTVLDVTLKILKSKGIPISMTGGGSTAYVQGIGNLFEFDRGPLSGWTVKQNGSTLSRSAGVTKVSNGDKIQWIYTTNYKED